MNSTEINAIVNALTNAGTTAAAAAATPTAGGQSLLGSLLGGLMHPAQASNTGLNIKDKTMTVAFVTANPSTAALLEAQGYTITVA